MSFRNPVLPGFHPDPSVCRVGDDYYLVTSSFEYFPGLPLFHSRDLVHWKPIGHVLTRSSQLPLADADASAGLYAPTLRQHQGRFYVVCTNVSAGGNFIVSADSIHGPWSEPIYIDQEGIDPSLFFDEDGSVLFTTSRFGALQSRIDLATGKRLSEPVNIWKGTGAQHSEGPHLFHKDGWVYLLMAEGGTEYGHMVVMARSRSPWGPFVACARNPVLTHRSHWSPIQALGHADLIEGPNGRWYAVLLGIRPNSYPPVYHLGRETFLCPVTWSEDGFPVWGEDGKMTLEMEGEPPAQPWPAEPAKDAFAGPTLGLEWVYLRNPLPPHYNLSARPGHLRLRGTAVGLDDKASPTWVGRRQCAFDLKLSVTVDFQASGPQEEAGICVRMNERHHYEAFVTQRQGVPTAVLRRRIGGLQAEVGSKVTDTGPQTLRLVADKDRYDFYVGEHKLGEGETRYVSTEVAGGFTGVLLALYASGNGQDCADPADFSAWTYAEA